jgi:hypothetical protein
VWLTKAAEVERKASTCPDTERFVEDDCGGGINVSLCDGDIGEGKLSMRTSNGCGRGREDEEGKGSLSARGRGAESIGRWWRKGKRDETGEGGRYIVTSISIRSYDNPLRHPLPHGHRLYCYPSSHLISFSAARRGRDKKNVLSGLFH